MPKILLPIPPAAFELIRDRITEILIEEFNYQDSLIVDADQRLNTSIYSERNVSFDKEDMPAINVMLTGGSFDNKNSRNANGSYPFNIDLYASAISSQSEGGDYKSNLKLQRMIAWCRAILENPEYDTLGFQRGTIVVRVGFSGFQIADPPKNDTENQTFCRMVFEVLANEVVELRPANLIDGYETKIKIDNTNRGYQYKGGNA